jgi:DNA-binding MarR family transcriptional regulator
MLTSARVIYFIKRVEVEVTSLMIQHLEEYEITPVQYTILSFIGINSTDFSSAQLSRRFRMTPQSMNEMVSNLLKKGLIEKNTDPNHKRILRLTLTTKGEELLEKCEKAIDIVEGRLMKNMSQEDIENFKKLMGKVISASREA